MAGAGRRDLKQGKCNFLSRSGAKEEGVVRWEPSEMKSSPVFVRAREQHAPSVFPSFNFYLTLFPLLHWKHGSWRHLVVTCKWYLSPSSPELSLSPRTSPIPHQRGGGWWYFPPVHEGFSHPFWLPRRFSLLFFPAPGSFLLLPSVAAVLTVHTVHQQVLLCWWRKK